MKSLSRIEAINGICPLCRAGLPSGVKTCNEIFQQVLAAEFENSGFAAVHLLTVDAYVLQHSEEHGPRSNAFHLLWLCSLLEFNGNPAIGVHVPRNRRKKFEEDYLAFPEISAPQKRGTMTIMDVCGMETPEAHGGKVREYARSVWNAYAEHHTWARGNLKLLGIRLPPAKG